MTPDLNVTRVGEFIKTHGIKGELSVFIANDGYVPREGKFIFVPIDSLYVPFRISSVRTKGSQSYLVSFKGLEDEKAAAMLVGNPVCVQPDEIEKSEDDEDVFYFEDLVGFTLIDNDTPAGIITDYDASTENCMFIIKRPDGTEAFVPAADELITDIDTENKILSMNLPQGLLELNA